MSHLRTNRAVAALAVGAALVLGTAACGVSASTDKVATGPTSAAEGARFLSGAAARTSKVTSERFSMTSTITAMGMDVTTTAEGAIDLAAKRGHITTTVSGGPEAVDGAMEVVVDGTTGYLSGEAFSMFLPKGKTWLKLDASSLAGKGGLGRELPGAGSATTDLDGAGSFLDLLTETGDTVTTVGTEDVRGTSTTHVRTRIQLDKVLAKAPEAKRKRIEKVITQLGSKADAITELPIDAWVDQDGYVRRLKLDPKPIEAGGETATGSVTIELYDFNEPVSVEAPPADQTVDFADAMGEGFGKILDGKTGGKLGGN